MFPILRLAFTLHGNRWLTRSSRPVFPWPGLPGWALAHSYGIVQSLYMVMKRTPNVARLHELGFQEAGTWALVGDKPRVNLHSHCDVCPALYAFVEDDIVVYVGKSVRKLRKRMQNYQTPV